MYVGVGRARTHGNLGTYSYQVDTENRVRGVRVKTMVKTKYKKPEKESIGAGTYKDTRRCHMLP